MADAVNVSTADLMAEIGRLTMEVKVRAAREDQLVAMINRMQEVAEAAPAKVARRRNS